MTRPFLRGAALALAIPLGGCVGTPGALFGPPPRHLVHRYHAPHHGDLYGPSGYGPNGSMSPSLAAAIAHARTACDAGTPGACDRLRALLSNGFSRRPPAEPTAS